MDYNQQAERKALEIMNRVFADVMPRPARWTYYKSLNTFNNSRKKDMYFYTTERVKHKGTKKFVSGIYRYNAKNKGWKALKEAGHAKRRDAAARALRLREKEKNGISRPHQ